MKRTEAEKAPETVMASWDGCPSQFAAAQARSCYRDAAESDNPQLFQ